MDKKLNGSNSVLEGKIHFKEKELAEENFKYLDLDELIFNFIKKNNATKTRIKVHDITRNFSKYRSQKMAFGCSPSLKSLSLHWKDLFTANPVHFHLGNQASFLYL